MEARCAPKFFQRCAEFLAAPMDQTPGITIAGGTADTATLTYMDDITLITRASFEFHIAYIGQFLDKLIHHGFTLNLDKCRFLQTSINFWGIRSIARAFRPHLPMWLRWQISKTSAW